jgi:hypothetical protein
LRNRLNSHEFSYEAIKVRRKTGGSRSSTHATFHWKGCTVSDSAKGDTPEKKPLDFKIEIDPKLGDSVQGGLDAIQKVFAGFVQTIKDTIGPETLRNLEAGNWLEQLAVCLDQIAVGLRDIGAVPPDKAGELAFYLEQWESAVQGSKFESQQAALRQRLDGVRQAVERVPEGNAAQEAKVLTEAAGYFHAAAKTAVPLQFGGDGSEKKKS